MLTSAYSPSCLNLNESDEHNDEQIIKAMEEHEQRSSVIEETETIDISDNDSPKKVQIGLTLSAAEREELIKTLKEYMDVFAWSYKDMPGIDTEIAQHKIPLIPGAKPVKQKLIRMKPDVALKIKEEVSK